ncbi:MAG: ABC transporter substrate-binding protein [Chloroflexota bacterium]|nr:ABC transporter substrate-binding protein [Chloroflexota bacterium]
MAGTSNRQNRARTLGGRIDRRTALKTGAALGLSLPTLPGLSSAAARPSTAGRSSHPRAQSTQLTLLHDKDPWQDYFAEMSALATEQLDIGFEGVPYSDTTSYQQVVNSSVQSGDAPDLLTWWSGYRLEALYDSGALLDVSDVWDTAIAAGDVPETLAAGFTFGDTQIGVPLNAAYWVVFYNKRVFDENSLTPPTTWGEFIAACDTIKAAGVTPLYATVDGRWPAFIWFEEFLIRNDPDFYVELCEGRASYIDAPAVKAMEDWKALFDSEYFSDLDIPMDSNFTGMFANGEIAMIPIGTWFQQQFLAQGMVPGEDYDAFIMPNVNPDLDRNVMIIETGAIVLPSAGQNIDASKEIAAWWLQTDAQTRWSGLLGDTPFNPNAAVENPVLDGIVATVGDNSYELLQRYWEASPSAIVENAVDELARFMLNPGEGMSVLESIQGIAEAEWTRREES